jgi:YD repeat-containing protein
MDKYMKHKYNKIYFFINFKKKHFAHSFIFILSLIAINPALSNTCSWNNVSNSTSATHTVVTQVIATQAQIDSFLPVPDAILNCGSYIQRISNKYVMREPVGGDDVEHYASLAPAYPFTQAGRLGGFEPYGCGRQADSSGNIIIKFRQEILGGNHFPTFEALAMHYVWGLACPNWDAPGWRPLYFFKEFTMSPEADVLTFEGTTVPGELEFASIGMHDLPINDTHGYITTTTTTTYTQRCTAPRVANGPICELPPNTADPKKNLSDSCNDVGDPCNACTGNMHERETDYIGIGPFPLRAERTYNSGFVEPSHWGGQWRGSYDRSLLFFTDGSISTVTLVRGDGKQYYFNLSGSSWVGDSDVVGSLVSVPAAGSEPTGWIYKNEAEETEVYDAVGKLISIANRAGLKQNLTYNYCATTICSPAEATLFSVVDPAGRSLIFTYDTSKHVTSMRDPNGGIYYYGYSDRSIDANLTYVRPAGGNVRAYLYAEAPHVSDNPAAGVSFKNTLTGIYDDNSAYRFSTWNYDDQGRVISSELGEGIEKVMLTYNSDGTTTVVDSLNTARNYSYSNVIGVTKNTGSTRPAGVGSATAVTALAYDANGNVASRTDFNGNLNTYVYNLTRNLETRRTEAVGSQSTQVKEQARAIAGNSMK